MKCRAAVDNLAGWIDTPGLATGIASRKCDNFTRIREIASLSRRSSNLPPSFACMSVHSRPLSVY